jgi:hypothetical protein
MPRASWRSPRIGVRLATLLVDCDPESLRVGQPVRVVFRPLPFPGEPEVVAPLFTPA